jgi:hypothetical protein
MEYKVSEIAAELKVAEKTIYTTWTLAGMPVRKDKTGHLWIHGESLAAWLNKHLADSTRYKKRTPMQATQAFCVKCRQPVEFSRVTKQEPLHSNFRVFGVGVCGHKIVRITKTKFKTKGQ